MFVTIFSSDLYFTGRTTPQLCFSKDDFTRKYYLMNSHNFFKIIYSKWCLYIQFNLHVFFCQKYTLFGLFAVTVFVFNYLMNSHNFFKNVGIYSKWCLYIQFNLYVFFCQKYTLFGLFAVTVFVFNLCIYD